MSQPISAPTPADGPEARSFRRSLLRGLGVVMPPLLTLVLFIWAWNLIENYVLRPVEAGIRYVVVWSIEDSPKSMPQGATIVDPNRSSAGFEIQGKIYVPAPAGKGFMPKEVFIYVNDNVQRLGPYQPAPLTVNAYWHRYVELKYLPRYRVVPVFLLVFVTVLYVLGRLFSHGVGRWLINGLERFIARIPLISNVYGSVKQVTDFVFSDRDIEFNRVVAVEYPRHGLWSIGFVTGNSLADISAAANESVLSVFMPTSPLPMTGFTITVRKSEAIDLELTIDQAIQFIVSCGVVVAPNQQTGQSGRLQLNLPQTPKTAGPSLEA